MEAAQKTHEVTRATRIMPVPPESLGGCQGPLASQGLGSMQELES